MTMAVAPRRQRSYATLKLFGLAAHTLAILRRQQAGQPQDDIDRHHLDEVLTLTRQTLRVMNQVEAGDFRGLGRLDTVQQLWRFVGDREPSSLAAQRRHLGLQHQALLRLRRDWELPPETAEMIYAFWGDLSHKMM